MTTPNKDSGQSGSGTTGSGGTVTSIFTDVQRQQLQNPTDYLNFFREIVSNAPSGVSQQQLLDSIADNYGRSGQTSGSRSSR